MGHATDRRGGRLKPPLEQYLLEIEQELWAWLTDNHYRTAAHDVRLRMRRKGVLPTSGRGGLPEGYRDWVACQKWNTLWWDGGMASQPYVLMAEFSVYEMVQQRFADYLKSIQQILSGGE